MTKENDQTISGAMQTYGNRLFRFIRGRVASNADAEDIWQEVWYQFTKMLNTEPIEQISAWLFRVARNKVTDSYRKKKPLYLEDEIGGEEDELSTFRELLLSNDPSPEMEMFQSMFWEELFDALDELPDNQRSVFVGNELEGQTLQEIADQTGEKLKTVISRKRYAVQHLRKRLERLYEEFSEI